MFENGGRTTMDGQKPEHGYTISSPCEPEGSGDLINWNNRINYFFNHILLLIIVKTKHSTNPAYDRNLS